MNINQLVRRIDEARMREATPALLLLCKADYRALRAAMVFDVPDGSLTSFMAVPVAQSLALRSHLIVDTFYGPEVWML